MSNTTQRLDELQQRVKSFKALGKKERDARRRQASNKLDALLEKIAVEKVCLMILQRLELEADKGEQYLEVMRFPVTYLKKGWMGGLFGEVPLEALNDPVSYKVFMKLQHMGLRPLLELDRHVDNSFPMSGVEEVIIKIYWGVEE